MINNFIFNCSLLYINIILKKIVKIFAIKIISVIISKFYLYNKVNKIII